MNNYDVKVYRVDTYKGDRSQFKDEAVFFADSLEYFDHSDTGYNKEDAKEYLLNLKDFKVFDPMRKWKKYIYANSWADIRCTEEFANKHGIEIADYLDEVDYDDPNEYHEVQIDTDSLAMYGRDNGYDVTILRNIPSRDGKEFTEYAVHNSNAVKSVDAKEFNKDSYNIYEGETKMENKVKLGKNIQNLKMGGKKEEFCKGKKCNEEVESWGLLRILELIGEAHNNIIEASEEIEDLENEDDGEYIAELDYALDDVEAELSEIDFMGEDDPESAAHSKFEESLKEAKEDKKEKELDVDSTLKLIKDYTKLVAGKEVTDEQIDEFIDNSGFDKKDVKKIVDAVEDVVAEVKSVEEPKAELKSVAKSDDKDAELNKDVGDEEDDFFMNIKDVDTSDTDTGKLFSFEDEDDTEVIDTVDDEKDDTIDDDKKDESCDEELKIVTKFDSFKPSAEKAIKLWNEIKDNDAMDTFEYVLEDMYPNGITLDELNDILSNDTDWIRDALGLNGAEGDIEDVD